MMLRRTILIPTTTLVLSVMMVALAPKGATQRDTALLDPEEAALQLERASEEAQRAEARASRLASEAESATRAADRSAKEAAAVAAQIQVAEAEIATAQAQYSIAQAARRELSARLAERQRPVITLTAALQTMAQRPLALSALQPASLRETVYVRAILNSAVPIVRERTVALRAELDQGRALEQDAQAALAALNDGEQALRARQVSLRELEVRQRLASNDARGSAVRERERALALAEEARDLDGLIDDLSAAAALRRELAALPGPVLRPARPSASVVVVDAATEVPGVTDSLGARFDLPVQGRIVSGFGAPRESGLLSTGITIVPAPGAQIIATGAGRVAFAGPYRGFGRIVIIEHDNGWTSLVTGLGRTSVEVGDDLVKGAPLGNAADQQPSVTIELRREGETVNPLEYID